MNEIRGWLTRAGPYLSLLETRWGERLPTKLWYGWQLGW